MDAHPASTVDMYGKKILVVSSGSRGDCQPFIALGSGLKKAGFNAVMFTNPEHEKLVTDLGVKFESNEVNFKDFFIGEGSIKAMKENNFLKWLQELGPMNIKYADKQYTAYYKLLESFKPDLVLCGTQHWPDAVWIPIVFRIPALVMNMSNTGTLDPNKPPSALQTFRLPFGMNGLLWKLMNKLWVSDLEKAWGGTISKLSGKPVERFMPTCMDILGLFGSFQPDDFHFMPYLIAQDENFVGRLPTDTPRHTYVGNLIIPAQDCKGSEFGGDNVAALDEFIAACGMTSPIYFGWGSLTCISAKWMTVMAVRSLKLIGRKGVIVGGYTDLNQELLQGEEDSVELLEYSKANIFYIQNAAHEVLFPKCAVIVHHGGIGTTLAGVRSGRPNVVTPIFYDQFDNGKLVEKSGQGIVTAQLPKLSPQDLADHVNKCLTDGDMIKKAAQLGKKMDERDGIKEATDVIIKFMRESLCEGDDASEYWVGFDAFARKKRQASLGLLAKLKMLTCCEKEKARDAIR